MTKRKVRNKRRFWPFALFMAIYAAIFLGLLGWGLQKFYHYLSAYEDSRPKYVLTEYMEHLTAEHICGLSAAVIDQVDHNIQSEEQCRAYILQALEKEFSYAKKAGKSTATKQVYAIRSGQQVIGEFTMEVVREDAYGFDYWEVTEETFDLSYLIGDTVSTVAPDHYTVSVNGVVLDDSYVVGAPIQYEALKPFYGDYTLPVMVTYQAGPFLGDFEMITTDTEGKEFILEDIEDLSKLAQNCTAEQIGQLDAFVDTFLKIYVRYMSSANKSAEGNLYELLQYVVYNSDFYSRMIGALAGQQVTQSRGDTIRTVTKNYFFRLEEGCYACDLTYTVDTVGHQGLVTTTNNIRVIVVETERGLRVLTVYNY